MRIMDLLLSLLFVIVVAISIMYKREAVVINILY